MKLTTLAIASLGIGAAHAATVTWDNGGADTNWFTGDNWDTNGVPNINGTDNVVISSAGTVTYNPGGDFDPGIGTTVTVTSSTVQQTVGNWQRMSGGTLTLDNATWTTPSNVRLAFDSGDAAGTINLTNGSSFSATSGEFWIGRPDTDYTNMVFNLNISGSSSVDFNGGVGLWLWDAELTGNDYNINFTGMGTIEGRIGSQMAIGGGNSTTWEALWNAGILQWNGANAGVFSDHFSTTGTSNTTSYQLTAVPEPSSAALLGLGGLALILRRRK